MNKLKKVGLTALGTFSYFSFNTSYDVTGGASLTLLVKITTIKVMAGQ